MEWISGRSGLKDKTATWNGVLKTLEKGLVTRASTTVSRFDIDRLLGEGNEPLDIIVFSCGHHLTSNSLNSKLLPGLESRILNKMPISGAAILDRYKTGDLKSVACPQCVNTSIQALVS